MTHAHRETSPATKQQNELLRAQRSAGAYAAHAKYGTEHMTAAARHAANVTRFEQQVDPDGVLDSVERAKRAEHARKAHMTSLSLKAVKARRLKAQARAAIKQVSL